MKDHETDAEPVPGESRDTLPAMDSGEKRLNELGYKQELKRDLVSDFRSLSYLLKFTEKAR